MLESSSSDRVHNLEQRAATISSQNVEIEDLRSTQADILYRRATIERNIGQGVVTKNTLEIQGGRSAPKILSCNGAVDCSRRTMNYDQIMSDCSPEIEQFISKIRPDAIKMLQSIREKLNTNELTFNNIFRDVFNQLLVTKMTTMYEECLFGSGSEDHSTPQLTYDSITPGICVPKYESVQAVNSFPSRNTDHKNVISMDDTADGNNSTSIAPVDQTQPANTSNSIPNEVNDVTTETVIVMAQPNAHGLDLSDLIETNSLMASPKNESTDNDLPSDQSNETIYYSFDDIGDDIATESEATLNGSNNESNYQLDECVESTCENAKAPSEEINSQNVEFADEQRKNQRPIWIIPRQKRKMSDVLTPNETSKKRRKSDLRSWFSIIPNSTSEKDSIGLTLDEVENSEQTSNTSIQPAEDQSADLSSVVNQGASTSQAKQKKKKVSDGKSANRKGKKEHKCKQCEYTSSRESKLIRHTRTHTGVKPFKCDHCELSFTRSDNLKTHMRLHTGTKPFKCEIIHCAREFSLKENLRRHMRTHANEFSFNCLKCKLGFPLKKEKDEHEKGCNVRIYESYLCDFTAFDKQDLARHMLIHSGEFPFQCSMCARKFKLNKTLKTHQRTHEKFPFNCSICQRGFSLEEAKEAHEKNCINFECDFCGYKSHNKSHLISHLRIHSGEKFSCSHCPKRFTLEHNLKQHLKKHQNVKNPMVATQKICKCRPKIGGKSSAIISTASQPTSQSNSNDRDVSKAGGPEVLTSFEKDAVLKHNADAKCKKLGKQKQKAVAKKTPTTKRNIRKPTAPQKTKKKRASTSEEEKKKKRMIISALFALRI